MGIKKFEEIDWTHKITDKARNTELQIKSGVKLEDKLIFKEESYTILGCCFEVFNKIGPGHREKTYQSALRQIFIDRGIKFQEQFHIPIIINDKKIGHNYFDFLINDKIILEIKQGDAFFRRDIEQIYAYLSLSGLKLGFLINFTSKGVKHRRIINSY